MPDLLPPPVPPAPPVGLINAAPGNVNTTPGTTPAGATPPGSPVTSYNPAAATAATANSTGYTANPFGVDAKATVASQLKGIIDSGSPLMQQAEANARNQMNARGLINSSQAITAGQSAVIAAATPIATTDAATYDRNAAATTAANNAAAQFGAAAINTGGLQDAAAQTQTNQYNAGQQNAALNQAATASNQVGLAKQQIDSTEKIAQLQADVSLTNQEKQNQTQILLQESQSALQERLAQISQNTTLTAQQMAADATAAKTAADNASQAAIAAVQSNTQLSLAQQKAESDKILASMNNAATLQATKLQIDGKMADILATGKVNTELQTMIEKNKGIIATNQGAASLVSQGLANLQAIINNPNLDEGQKTQALNNTIVQLDSGVGLLTQIAGLPDVMSTITYNSSNATTAPRAATTPPATPRRLRVQRCLECRRYLDECDCRLWGNCNR